MAFKTFKLGTAVKTSVESVGEVEYLIKGDTAAALLPPDTKFALVIESIEKNFNDSFAETDANLATMSLQWSQQGAVGRFMGYLTLTDNMIRIYKAMDLDITKPADPSQPTPIIDSSRNISLIFEDYIANINATMDGGVYVLSNSQKKYKLVNIYVIAGLNGRFESKAGGLQGGLKPLFSYMNSHGGHLKFSNQNNIFAVIVLGFFIAFCVFLLHK